MDKRSEKHRIRHEMKELRDGLDVLAVERLSEEVFENFKKTNLNEFEKFFVYNSFGSEVKTQKIIKNLFLRGKRVYMPKINEKQMQAVLVDKQTNFKRGSFGIFEPVGELEEFDDFVAVIPCIAVDKDGNRIGYGGGYYDKFLKGKNALKVALCYDFQIVDKIPAEDFDVQVDIIVSDKSIIKPHAKG